MEQFFFCASESFESTSCACHTSTSQLCLYGPLLLASAPLGIWWKVEIEIFLFFRIAGNVGAVLVYKFYYYASTNTEREPEESYKLKINVFCYSRIFFIFARFLQVFWVLSNSFYSSFFPFPGKWRLFFYGFMGSFIISYLFLNFLHFIYFKRSYF